MIPIAVLRSLVSAGATAEMIVDAVEAEYNSRKEQREKDATRKRMSRGHPRTAVDGEGKEKVSHTLPKENTTSSFPSENSLRGTNPRALGCNPRNQTPTVIAWMNSFEQFWKVFPRRVAKGAAKKAYKNALRRASSDEILAGARRYAATNPDPEFTAFPATWLNADRWLDEHKVVEFRNPAQRTWAEIKADKERQQSP
jgi:hypothetical protein